jgi:hypothetical protein
MAKGLKTGGRQKGVKNKASIERQAAIAASGLTPVDFLLGIMRDTEAELGTRIDAGKAVAPYIHPKLANIEMTGKDGGPLQVKLVQFGNDSKPVGTTRLPNEGLGRSGTGVPPRHTAVAP